MTKKQLYDFHQFFGSHMPKTVLHLEYLGCDIELCDCGMFFAKTDLYHGWCSEAMIKYYGKQIDHALGKSVCKDKQKAWRKYCQYMKTLPRKHKHADIYHTIATLG